ncbi:hypothetical protein BCR33DRAFT_711022 [Rhizoclosmatium globosum]|uniref:Membrane anchor Opy2 N-terminal domain-containing protein n=1 Tax=Rhizoclosmatium globosum TaxID=329046 RepID=A0A1Y2D349_9FUNG|nr:hypothetical protein BCR33DRAFT_711022 [Rhizoclosmatium globosum]|eukprot:ORY53637.1 hypothetical protein BCR33DRAFT_711022 [Rhizoclosmatium globosum]
MPIRFQGTVLLLLFAHSANAFLCACSCNNIDIGTISATNCDSGCSTLANSIPTSCPVGSDISSLNLTYIITGGVIGFIVLVAACFFVPWVIRRRQSRKVHVQGTLSVRRMEIRVQAPMEYTQITSFDREPEDLLSGGGSSRDGFLQSMQV